MGMVGTGRILIKGSTSGSKDEERVVNTVMVLDIPDGPLKNVTHGIEVDTTGVMRAVLRVLCAITRSWRRVCLWLTAGA
jgi:hypothetical protein